MAPHQASASTSTRIPFVGDLSSDPIHLLKNGNRNIDYVMVENDVPDAAALILGPNANDLLSPFVLELYAHHHISYRNIQTAFKFFTFLRAVFDLFKAAGKFQCPCVLHSSCLHADRKGAELRTKPQHSLSG